MEYFAYKNACLCPLDGTLPDGAEKAPEPFFPLVFLRSSDPLFSRSAYSIDDVREASEPDGPQVLCALTDESGQTDNLSKMVKEKGALVINTAFQKSLEYLIHPLPALSKPAAIHIAGLGDVGGTLLIGLVLLGSGTVKQIGLYDPDMQKCMRYEQEVNQILPLSGNPPSVRIICKEELFDCDIFVFTASKSAPPSDADLKDVRIVQLEGNKRILAPYARMARKAGFKGLFAQVSDPVDHLSRAVFLESNKNELGKFDFQGLLPEQIRGFGLGVMAARASYFAKKRGVEVFPQNGRVFGPHGRGLVAANDYGAGYDPEISELLTRDAVTANIKVRETGYKPFIAPGLSSACISLLRLLKGEWHDSAIPLGGVYFGCRSRLDERGIRTERLRLHPKLYSRIEWAYTRLKESFDELL
ncbi:MAG: L-lactate dehydrogenase 2 [Firmicutes bacterium ADurb.Bin182]|nr:MAG: L-lactate dehydrogenase 2 [Firmicutes bacterium ADurb.Bin182]